MMEKSDVVYNPQIRQTAPKKRILILHISEFGGHKKASKNIEETFYSVNPEVEVRNVNGFGYVYPRAERLIDSIYTFVIKRIPSLWGRLYDRKGVAKTLAPVRKIVSLLGFRKFRRLIGEFRPHAVIATQAFPCGLAADFKRHCRAQFHLVAAVTDYHPHRFWINDGVDIYVVATEDAKQSLISNGVPETKIKPYGIPISLEFLYTHSKESVAASFGFDLSMPAVLIMGGNYGYGPIREVVKQLDSLPTPFQLIIVCGRNKKLFRWFRKKQYRFKKPLFYYGYIDFVHKLMDFSDIIVTKAGGITVAEALSKGLGIIVVDPIPGQEERNVTYLEEHRAVVYAHNLCEIPGLVQTLFSDQPKLISLKRKAREHSIKDASLKITDCVLTRCQS